MITNIVKILFPISERNMDIMECFLGIVNSFFGLWNSIFS
jgi:hypothetical protein